MGTNESTEGSRSRSRSLDIQPSSEGLGPTSERFPSSDDSPRSPPTTWIKSQACRMALRVFSSDTDTGDC
uniref:Sperm associated antigen 8 n=1 Tax=Gorilla gorilla gorilla TaxID=9595 RepID=A0A2I2ZE84_GORGO